ncbi:hypothetical protein AAG570_012272 [Ranatra chinensis]|uniref:C2 domain-containing protein n=1 Tax=Ranatra chinensis TaxID=642074 RepID=A0ABD0YIJ1_9HEMI
MWHTVPGIGLHIVPEHVEMRTLYHPDKPDIESGKLEMWVDILPQKEAPLPPQVDIKPRKPEDFVLRVIVWKTSKIELVDESLLIGKKHGDILIKGWLLGNDRQQTDVHFVCTTGDALFNWRFIFPFPYIKAEKLMVLNKKAMKQLVEIKKPPILHIEAWDYDRFSLNEYIGNLLITKDFFLLALDKY